MFCKEFPQQIIYSATQTFTRPWITTGRFLLNQSPILINPFRCNGKFPNIKIHNLIKCCAKQSRTYETFSNELKKCFTSFRFTHKSHQQNPSVYMYDVDIRRFQRSTLNKERFQFSPSWKKCVKIFLSDIKINTRDLSPFPFKKPSIDISLYHTFPLLHQQTPPSIS